MNVRTLIRTQPADPPSPSFVELWEVTWCEHEVELFHRRGSHDETHRYAFDEPEEALEFVLDAVEEQLVEGWIEGPPQPVEAPAGPSDARPSPARPATLLTSISEQRSIDRLSPRTTEEPLLRTDERLPDPEPPAVEEWDADEEVASARPQAEPLDRDQGQPLFPDEWFDLDPHQTRDVWGDDDDIENDPWDVGQPTHVDL